MGTKTRIPLGQQLVGVAQCVAVHATLVFEGGVPVPELLNGGPGGGAERLLPQRQYGRIGERGQGGVAVRETLQGLQRAVRAGWAVVGRGQAVVVGVADEGCGVDRVCTANGSVSHSVVTKRHH
ncbi:hypothetical protein [Streptomyces brevispora]|uniref:hypothetical protein n=1 Tax=Streptomyces brevispora TaxID=887462 RepID=UPI0035D7B0B7